MTKMYKKLHMIYDGHTRRIYGEWNGKHYDLTYGRSEHAEAEQRFNNIKEGKE